MILIIILHKKIVKLLIYEKIIFSLFYIFSIFNLFTQDAKSIFQIKENSNCILEVSNGKFYIDPNFLSINEKRIKLNLGNESISIYALYSDKKGIYLKDKIWPLSFICKRCVRLNNDF